MYRLVFLDVDGVLNSVLQFPYSQTKKEDPLQQENLLAFASIFKTLKPAPAIVISSTWKYKEESLALLRAALEQVGVLDAGGQFLSQTPDLRDSGPGFPKEHAHNTRTDEIMTWLKFNTVATDKQEIRERAYPLPFGAPSAKPPDWTGNNPLLTCDR